jgi:drug/metabolite transporter (DMT)-like permease
VGLLLLYSSTRFLYVGVASAVSAVVACVIPVAYAALTQPMSVQEAVGVAVCVLALMSVARWRGDSQVAMAAGVQAGAVPAGAGAPAVPDGGRRRQELLGVGAALASGVGMGLYYIALAGASAGEQVGEALESRLVSVLVLCVIALSAQRSSLVPRRRTLASALGTGAFGVVGSLAYATAVRTGSLGVVVPIVSLSPAVTIVAAWLVLSERVSNRQLAGLVLAMVGVAIVTA